MIPKVIHYCWFGGNPLPDDVKQYIESWRKYCPDYEIKEWNEQNFNLDMYPYAREAYDNRKFAFVADIVRLYACYNEGGIYLDTDVEVIKNLDCFLEHEAFSGFESTTYIQTALMACRKGFPLFKELLDEYNSLHFIKSDGSLDLTTNVVRITNTCSKYGFIPNGEYQIIKGFTLYPSDFFCPKDWKTGKINCTKNAYIIHHFAGSWLTEEQKKRHKFQQKIEKIFGNSFISGYFMKGYYFFERIRKDGLVRTAKRYLNKTKEKKQ